MKQSLRKITIDETEFLWRHAFGYVDTGAKNYRSASTLSIYKSGFKQGRLLVDFETWEDAVLGNPLNQGIAVDENTPPINLNKPKEIRKVILYALENGWNGEVQMHIKDGFVIFRKGD